MEMGRSLKIPVPELAMEVLRGCVVDAWVEIGPAQDLVVPVSARDAGASRRIKPECPAIRLRALGVARE